MKLGRNVMRRGWLFAGWVGLVGWTVWLVGMDEPMGADYLAVASISVNGIWCLER